MPNHADVLKPAVPLRDRCSLDALYAAHGERSFGNPAWDEAPVRFLVVRLSPFRDVERSAPHAFIYREIRGAVPGAYIDFGFYPAARDRAFLAGHGVPAMHGIASARGAVDFDAILVSNSYTLELVNLVPYLSASGIPATRQARERAEAGRDGSRLPLVILGGSNAMATSSLNDEATGDSIVDAVYFGEGEGSVGRLAVALAGIASMPGAGEGRRAALAGLAGTVTGFWPSAGRGPVSQAKAVSDEYPRVPPPVFAGEEAGTVRLEITKGCPSFCTFCFEGWERKPFRERPIEAIFAEARALKAAVGASTVELASYNFNAHSRIVDIIKGLNGQFDVVSFQSQRVDILARSPGLVRFEAAAGKRSFTVGVEGISARARAYFNKELPEADLRAVLGRMVGEGAREIKLFYILSGFEDEPDIAEFSAFVGWLQSVVAERPAGSRPRVMVSAGELIRMPFTPLAYERLMLEPAAYEALAARLGAIVERGGFEYRAPEGFDEYCLSQVLALAPPGSMGLLLALAGHGHVYDRNLSRGAWGFARGWLDERGSLGDSFTGEKARDYPFPYSFVKPVASRELAWSRYLDAKAARERASCLGASCSGCGACDDGERAFLESHSLDTVSERDMRDIETTVAAKRKPFMLWIRSTLERGDAAAHPAYAASRFLRGLYAAVPSLVDVVWKAEDVLLASRDGLDRLPGAWGDTWYRLSSSRPLDAQAIEAAGYRACTEAPAPERLSVVASLPGAGLAEALSLVSDFMNGAAMPYTLVKSAGAARLDVSAKGLKKRNVIAMVVSATDGSPIGGSPTGGSPIGGSPIGGSTITMTCGAKYDLGAIAALAARRRLAFDLRVALY